MAGQPNGGVVGLRGGRDMQKKKGERRRGRRKEGGEKEREGEKTSKTEREKERGETGVERGWGRRESERERKGSFCEGLYYSQNRNNNNKTHPQSLKGRTKWLSSLFK